MEKFCQNPYCESPSFKEVPVSVKKPSDQVRALCGPCEEAYTWGVQHGRKTAESATSPEQLPGQRRICSSGQEPPRSRGQGPVRSLGLPRSLGFSGGQACN